MTSLPMSRLAVATLLGLTLAGCNLTGSHDSQMPLDYRDRHPIVLTQEPAVLPLFVGSSANQLTRGDVAALNAFLLDYRQFGDGSLRVQIPAGTANEAAAVNVLRDVHQVVSSGGIDPRNVVVETYSVPSPEANAPVRVMFDRVTAVTNQCSAMNGFIETTHANRTYANFGCASQANLAAMLADPRDIARPRGLGPADPTRRTTVLEAYRNGQPTAAQAEQAEATVANVGN